MADTEKLILAKAIETEDFTALVEGKIGEKFFIDPEHRLVFQWMQDHWQKYGKCPSAQALRRERPNYKLPSTPEPMSYYLAEIRREYKYDVLSRATQDAASELKRDDAEEDIVSSIFSEALIDVQSTTSAMRDHNLTDPVAFSKLYQQYIDLTKNKGQLRGMPTGFPTLDEATMGYTGGQLVTFAGPPKAGKSTVLLCSADAVCRSGRDVLLISFEMSYQEQVARWVGLRTGMDYRTLLTGSMKSSHRGKLDELSEHLNDDSPASFTLSEDVSSTTTVSGIIAKIQQFNPKVLFIDGVYLMDDEHGEPKGSSAAITNITRSLKRAAQTFDIPIVISTQVLFSKMQGKKVVAGSVGYSSSFGQDSDVLIAVEPRENADTGDSEHWLKVLLSRSGPMAEAEIQFDWSTSTFEEYGTTTEEYDRRHLLVAA